MTGVKSVHILGFALFALIILSVVVAAESVTIGTPTDLLELNESLGDVRKTLTEFDLSILKGGSIITRQGATRYNQYINLPFNETLASDSVLNVDATSAKVIFNEDEFDNVGNFLHWKDQQTLFQWQLEFEEGLISGLTGADATDLLGKSVHILGEFYIITDANFNTSSKESYLKLISANSEIIFHDTNYSDNKYTNAGTIIDGEVIEDSSFRMRATDMNGPNGITVTLSDITYVLKSDAWVGDLFVPPGYGVREYLDEPIGMITPYWDIVYEGLHDTGTTLLKLNPIDRDEYKLEFTNQEGLRYVVPFLSTRQDGNLRFGDFSSGRQRDLRFMEGIDNSQHTVRLQDYFVLSDIQTGPVGNKRITGLSTNSRYPTLTIDQEDNTAFTHILKYESIDITNQVLTFTDLATGVKQVVYDAANNSNLVVGGITYKLNVAPISTIDANLSIDLDGDGSRYGGMAIIAIEGGGLLTMAPSATDIDTYNPIAAGPLDSPRMFSLTSLDSEFDEETGISHESVGFAVESRPSNRLGINRSMFTGIQMFYLTSEPEIAQGMTEYGSLWELFDPLTTDTPEELTIEHPLSQRTPIVKVVSDDMVIDPPLVVSDILFGGPEQERGVVLQVPVSIQNDGFEGVTIKGLAMSSVPSKYNFEYLGGDVFIPARTAGTVTLRALVPLDHDAINSDGDPAALDIGTISFHAENHLNNTINSLPAVVRLQAENKLELRSIHANIFGTMARSESLEDGSIIHQLRMNDSIELAIDVENNHGRRMNISFPDAFIMLNGPMNIAPLARSIFLGPAENKTIEFEISNFPNEQVSLPLKINVQGRDTNGALHGSKVELILAIDQELPLEFSKIEINNMPIHPSQIAGGLNISSSDNLDINVQMTSKELLNDASIDLSIMKLENGTPVGNPTFGFKGSFDMRENITYSKHVAMQLPEGKEFELRVIVSHPGDFRDKISVFHFSTNTQTRPPANPGNLNVTIIPDPIAIRDLDSLGRNIANNNLEDGLRFRFNLSLPSNETNFTMRVDDWQGQSGTIPTAANTFIEYGGNRYIVGAAQDYSNSTSFIVADESADEGVQFTFDLMVRVPRNTLQGSYSTSFGLRSLPQEVLS